MTDREMIEQACASHGFVIRSWDEEHENGLTAKLGTFRVQTDEYEDEGLYLDSEGELDACVVGSEEYGNRSVSFSFVEEGLDGGNPVRDLTALEPVT